MNAKEAGRRQFLKQGAGLAGLAVGAIRSASGASAINCWQNQHNALNCNMLGRNSAPAVLVCSKSGISAFSRMRLRLATNN